MKDILEFINSCTDAWHTTDEIAKELRANGFIPLEEGEEWGLSPDGKYYVTRNLSSIIAFKIPKSDFDGFMISAAHGESPSFKIKSIPTLEDGNYIRLSTEAYGSASLGTWLDRPLSVSGRVIVKTDKGLETRLVNLNQSTVVIPSLAPHIDSAKNSSDINIKRDMPPLYALAESGTLFIKEIASAAGVNENCIMGTDLMLYNKEKGIIWGPDNEFISAPRLDDLQCVYALLNGFLAGNDSNTAQVFCVFDNEEVGSGTKQGAKADFLSSTLHRISTCCGKDYQKHLCSLANSFMVSADNAHALHPNRKDASDETNYPTMNKGVVIKYNASQRYTTDAVSEAIFKTICDRANIPHQVYANRSDISGGSTLGNIATEKTSVNTVDIGIAQLSMHSAYETAGAKDTDYLIGAITSFYNSSLKYNNGNFVINCD